MLRTEIESKTRYERWNYMRKRIAGFLASMCLAWEIFKFDIMKFIIKFTEAEYDIDLLVW